MMNVIHNNPIYSFLGNPQSINVLLCQHEGCRHSDGEVPFRCITLHNDHTQLCNTSNLNSIHLGGCSSLLSSLVHAPVLFNVLVVCSSNDLWNKSNHILQKKVVLKLYDPQASTHFLQTSITDSIQQCSCHAP